MLKDIIIREYVDMINDRLYLIRLKQIKKENFFYYKEEKELLEDIVKKNKRVEKEKYDDEERGIIFKINEKKVYYNNVLAYEKYLVRPKREYPDLLIKLKEHIHFDIPYFHKVKKFFVKYKLKFKDKKVKNMVDALIDSISNLIPIPGINLVVNALKSYVFFREDDEEESELGKKIKDLYKDVNALRDYFNNNQNEIKEISNEMRILKDFIDYYKKNPNAKEESLIKGFVKDEEYKDPLFGEMMEQLREIAQH